MNGEKRKRRHRGGREEKREWKGRESAEGENERERGVIEKENDGAEGSR